MEFTLILTCAGSGSRAKTDGNKLLKEVNNKNCIDLSLNAFVKSGLINQYIITASKSDFDFIVSRYKDIATVVIGGKTRSQSVKNALKLVNTEAVLIHDGARPFVSQRIIKECVESVKQFGSGVTAIPSRDTICLSKGSKNQVDGYIGKDGLFAVQTPQGFLSKDIINAYENIGDGAFNDDGEIYLNSVKPPKIVLGDKDNVKITFSEDFELLRSNYGYRIGTGFDCHRLTENRKLILGGVEIPFEKGLLGHSDADVLTHAVMDAILSAASMRDIGYHFSDKDEKYKDICSMTLLEKVLEMIKDKGFSVANISAVIMAEKPKLINHIPLITKSLADALSLNIDEVGITATTLEGLGFVGREEGICASATASLIFSGNKE